MAGRTTKTKRNNNLKNISMTRQEILNEILDDVRKYRAYLVYKRLKKPRHTPPKFNFWDMRDSIEQTLNKFGI